MSAASRQRERKNGGEDKAVAQALKTRARECLFYKNLGKPGRYEINGKKIIVEVSGQIRNAA